MAAFMFPHTHVNKNNGSDLVVAIIINININGIQYKLNIIYKEQIKKLNYIDKHKTNTL